jgi:DNA gyrase subunit A
VADVSIVGRNTQGVTLIRLNDGEKLVQIAPILTDVADENADVIEDDADVGGSE